MSVFVCCSPLFVVLLVVAPQVASCMSTSLTRTRVTGIGNADCNGNDDADSHVPLFDDDVYSILSFTDDGDDDDVDDDDADDDDGGDDDDDADADDADDDDDDVDSDDNDDDDDALENSWYD